MTTLFQPSRRKGVSLSRVVVSDIKMLTVCSQSNGNGQGIQALPNVSATPHLVRSADETLDPVNFYRKMGTYTRTQAVDTGTALSLGNTPLKHGLQTQADIDLRAAGKSPLFVTVARSGTDTSYWLSGAGGRTLFTNTMNEVLALGISPNNWHVMIAIGESNILDGRIGSWQGDVTDFITYMRTILPNARVGILLASPFSGVGTSTDRTNLIAAQNATVGAVSNSIAYDASAGGAGEQAPPHYTSAGYNRCGSIWAADALANLP